MDKKLAEYISNTMKEKILNWSMCKWCNLEYPLFGKESVFLEKR
jgi:hypothetical protein